MKKYILKAISTSALIVFAFVLTGCGDLLDQAPQGQWTADDNKGGSYQTDIFTLYAKMRGFNVTSGSPALAIHNFRSEDVETGTTASDGSAQRPMYDDFEYNASNGLIQSYYASNFDMIHIVNRVLDKMSTAEKNGETLTDGDIICRGEAHFFRAFAYFNLVRAFGEVPYIDFKIEDAAEAILPKSPASKIYELIDKDLTEAENSLPPMWESRFVGRLTWGAAKSLHAKTYLMRNDWANTYSLAMEVINSNIYNLDTPYDQIFRETGENCSESILELQCTATSALPGSNDIGSQFCQVQGVRGAGDWNMGWGWHTPTQLLADAFEPGDPRKDETLLYFVKTGEDPATIPANKPWGEKPVANGDVLNKYYNKKAYTNPALRTLYTKGGFWFNIRLIRLSDVILMAAESANEMGGKADEAIELLERVRARARAGNSAILPKVTTTDQVAFRNAVRHERRVELGMEWDRFYDLVRWGTAQQVLHAAGKTNYQNRHALLPLPQAEIDKSNGVLVQNPNYSN